jgi:arylsulfatase A-like enzyme
MDAAVGRIVEALKKAGKLRSTLILFTSDNGGQRDYRSKKDYGGKHGPYATLGDNRPLRGWKGDLYEGGVRVPAFASWSGKLRRATVEQVTSYLDVFPTLAGLAGVKVDPAWKLEGRDVWPILSGSGKAPAATLYWNTGRQSGVLHGEKKLIVTRRGGKEMVEMYDLADDPGEKKDLAGAQPRTVETLRKVLAEQSRGDR